MAAGVSGTMSQIQGTVLSVVPYLSYVMLIHTGLCVTDDSRFH